MEIGKPEPARITVGVVENVPDIAQPLVFIRGRKDVLLMEPDEAIEIARCLIDSAKDCHQKRENLKLLKTDD